MAHENKVCFENFLEFAFKELQDAFYELIDDLNC